MDFYKLALLGHPLGHSRSPEMHARALEHCNLKGSYELIDIEENELETTLVRLKKEGYAGLNVTIPYKEKIIPLLDTVPGPPLQVGAVNTVLIEKGNATGYNTDIFGASVVILDFFKDVSRLSNIRALILGSGGAAKACVYALQQLNCKKICISSRNREKGEQIVKQYSTDKMEISFDPFLCSGNWSGLLNPEQFTLLINATPLGQATKNPLQAEYFDGLLTLLSKDVCVFDMVYASGHQKETPLVSAANKRGLEACDGTLMLAEQAAQAFQIWTGKKVSPEVMLGRSI
ncbi:MAG: shikimate dehydrogenase [Cyanobacteria bacterium TGS_CYA1]|nr:shikimate dehydrogenase [Cyanobacteria bacterium TGS_CYA1]